LTHINGPRQRRDIIQLVLERIEVMSNVGSVDRIVRIVVGVVLIAYAIPIGFHQTGWNWTGWIGVVPLLTAIFGYCPAYSLFGISTCSAKQPS
jgi:hypothetical protein